MGLDSYTIVYLISNLFGAYIISRFMNVFFSESRTSIRIETISYILYFIITSSVYLLYKSPAINLISNLIFFVLLTFNYVGTWKMRAVATILIYAIMLSVEALVVIGLNYLNINQYFRSGDIELIIALISVKIVSYIVVLVLSNFRMVKTDISLSYLHWVAIFFIPLGTLYSTFLLITQNRTFDLVQILIGITILFAINVFVFYLYDTLNNLYKQELDRELLQQQIDAYSKQFDLIKQNQHNISMVKHDIKNHITAVQDLIRRDELSSALEYNKSILASLDYPHNYVDSGNPEVDSILNYKTYEAEKQDIKMSIDIKIPEKIAVEPFDLSVIIGNLLDNAIEATMEVKVDRVIQCEIEYERSTIFIRISNPYTGVLHFMSDKLLESSKNDKNRGWGLRSVQESVNKYDGLIDFQTEEGLFCVKVLIYTS